MVSSPDNGLHTHKHQVCVFTVGSPDNGFHTQKPSDICFSFVAVFPTKQLWERRLYFRGWQRNQGIRTLLCLMKLSSRRTVDTYSCSAFSLIHFRIQVSEWVYSVISSHTNWSYTCKPHRNTQRPISHMILDFVKLITLITIPTTMYLKNYVAWLILSKSVDPEWSNLL